MSEFNPYFTADGSVGLYNEEFDDVYHSAGGALSEAYEKFIFPSNIIDLLRYETVKVLDICFGIGYNSKSFLNSVYKILKNDKKFLKNFYHAEYSIETIHTNNIFSRFHENFTSNISPSIGSIYTHNNLRNIYIKAVDNNPFLPLISPFIKTGVNKFKNNHDKYYDKVAKYFSVKKIKYPKIDNSINYLLLSSISREYFDNYAIKELFASDKYMQYFERDLIGLYNVLIQRGLINESSCVFRLNLHNIYYRYISNRYKNRLKALNYPNLTFDLKIDDARQAILSDNNVYNLIFLDAFTPTKCPCLWSYDFFNQLYNHLDNEGMLLTYSSSSAVRSAMINSGFYIGNIYNSLENKTIGTIAVKNKALIQNPLTEFDLGLLKTTAGIFYRDENLTGLNEAIIERRNIEVKNSKLLSSSQFIKKYKNL